MLSFPDDELHFLTSTNTTLGYSTSPIWSVFDKTDIIFSVKACQDAHIALTTVPGVTSTLAYEIILGAESKYMSFVDYQC